MNLLVQTNDVKFIKYLINKIKLYVISNIKKDKITAIEDFINKNYQSKLIKHISVSDIIKSAANNLKFVKQGDTYTIYIDNNQIVYGTQTKLIELCKLINYGNMEVAGYPIFDDTFNYFNNNIEEYFGAYQGGIM